MTNNGKLAGLLRARITQDDESGFAPHEYRPLPSEAKLRVVDVLSPKGADQPPNSWTWWPADPETLAYP